MKRMAFVVWLVVIFTLPCIADEKAPLPNCKPNRQGDYYSPQEIRLSKVGSVLVEYTVKGPGAPVNIVVIRSTAPRTLEDSAKSLVRDLRCSPGNDWMESEWPQHRLRVNVVFRLRGFDETAEPLDPEAEVVVITGSSI